MLALVDLAREVGAHVLTLEVRLSNAGARTLYGRFGFRPVGLRPRYSSDNGEDALVMTTDPLDSPAMRARIADLARRYGADALEDQRAGDGPSADGDAGTAAGQLDGRRTR
jgi:ribosomal protein S18 acetylase RimI-like enzyme